MTRNANGTPDKDESSNINVMVPSTTSSSSQQNQQSTTVSSDGDADKIIIAGVATATDDDDDDDVDNGNVEGAKMEIKNDMKSLWKHERLNSMDDQLSDIDLSLPLDSPIITSSTIDKYRDHHDDDDDDDDRKNNNNNNKNTVINNKSKNCDGIPTTINKRLISKHEMKEFRDAFRLFDKDGDGTITKEELGSVMRSLGQFARGGEIQEMLQEIDADGDGNVSFEEFVDILSNMTDATTETSAAQEERELRDAFRVFDKHNRGYITASDLRAVLQCLGEDLDEDEIEDMIKEVDVDGDGKIDFFEFVHALTEPEDSQDDGEGDEDDEDDDDDDDDIISPLTPQKSIISPIP